MISCYTQRTNLLLPDTARQAAARGTEVYNLLSTLQLHMQCVLTTAAYHLCNLRQAGACGASREKHTLRELSGAL